MSPDLSTVRRVGAIARHQCVLMAGDPGPLIAFIVMPMVLVSVIQPMMVTLAHAAPGEVVDGTGQATAGMAVMFSLFVLKLAGASLLDEWMTWRTWDRVRSSPARVGEVLAGKAAPMLGYLLAQQFVLFVFASVAFGLRSTPDWGLVAVVGLVWALCVLALGSGVAMLVRTSAQLSAVGDISAVVITIMGGALVPSAMLPDWMNAVGPVTPGYWAMRAYRSALDGQAGAEFAQSLAVLGGFTALGLVTGAVVATVRASR